MQELRDIATVETIKGKHFFLESDLKGEVLKLDHTGKAILTVSGLDWLPCWPSYVMLFTIHQTCLINGQRGSLSYGCIICD